jgi:hypothetical protein
MKKEQVLEPYKRFRDGNLGVNILTAKATRKLKVLSKTDFQECFQKLYKRWQKCATAQGSYVEGIIYK